MSKRFTWFQCNNVAELEQDKEKCIEQIIELVEEIKAINEKIAEIKSENEN